MLYVGSYFGWGFWVFIGVVGFSWDVVGEDW